MSTNFIKNNILVFAILSPIFFIGTDGFPFLGLSLFFVWLSSLIFLSTEKKGLDNYFWLTINCLLALSLTFRASAVLIALNIIFLLYSLCWQLFNKDEEVKYSFGNIIILPIVLLFNLSGEGKKYRFSFLDLKTKTNSVLQKVKTKEESAKENSKDGSLIIQTFLGLLVTFLTLTITIPLLASSNPIFGENIRKFFSFLSRFFDIFSAQGILHILISIVLLLVLPYFFFALNQEKSTSKLKTVKIGSFGSLFFNIPKIALFSILILFFISEIQFYFASSSPDMLRALNIGLGNLNREIFGRLSVVTFIIFAFTFFDKNQKKFNKTTSLLLLGEAFLLFLISAKTLLDYVSSYSLTFIRYSGLVLLVFVFGNLLIQTWSVLKQSSESKIVKTSLYYLYIILILINIFPFQFLIFTFNKPQTREDKVSVYKDAGFGLEGASYGYDSYNIKKIHTEYEELYKVEKALQKEYQVCENIQNNKDANNNKSMDECLSKLPSRTDSNKYYDYRIVNSFEREQKAILNLRAKYENLDFRNFNLAEYIAYKQFEGVDIKIDNTSDTQRID